MQKLIKAINRPLTIITTFLMFLTLLPVNTLAATGTDETPLSVSEAIQTQDGAVHTVRGYITGTVLSATSVDIEAPFTQNTNLAIADSATETDPAKMLYIQLPTGAIRDAWNLAAHPENKGSQVDITGTLTNYFVPHAGLKSTSAITLLQGGGGTEPVPTVTAPVTFEFYDDMNNVIHENIVKDLEVGTVIVPKDHAMDIPDYSFYYGTAGVTVSENGNTIKMVYKSTRLYVVDAATGTILRFNGTFPYYSENYLDIPSAFDGVDLKNIAANAFYAKSIRYLTIPEGIETIGNLAFGSNNLFTVTFPTTLRELGKNAFSGQYIKGDIDLSGTQLTRIEEGTFSGTAGSEVNELKLPESLIFIGKSAFSGSKIKMVNIPDTVSEIGANAFSNNNLTSLNLPKELTVLGDGAFFYNAIGDLTLNDKLTVIPARAFEGNRLTEIRLPETVKEVGAQAFAGNPLTYFEYWSGTVIGADQFRWNSNEVKMVEMTHVIHNYTDNEGNILSEEDIPQPVGTVLSPKNDAKTFERRELMDAPESYTVVSGENVITYVYGPEAPLMGTVNLVYQDEEGNKLTDDETITSEAGTTIIAADHSKMINGYELTVMPEDMTVAEGEQTITYIYRKVVKAECTTITVRFEDQDGNMIAEPLMVCEKPGTVIHLKKMIMKKIGQYKLETKVNWHIVGSEDETITLRYLHK